jgi:SAM-dependent methyltransferase
LEEWLYHKFFEVEKKHWWFVGRQEIVQSMAAARAQLPKNPRVLDVGCGTGAILEAFSRSSDAWGLDSSSTAIELCARRGLRNTWTGLLKDFPKEHGQFDLILLLDVIEHISDDVQVLKESRERLSPGGKLLITVPAFQWLWSSHDVANHHQRRYSKSLLKSRLAEAGLRPQFISYYNTLLFPLALISRLIEAVSTREKDPSKMDPGLKMPPALVNSLLAQVFSSERAWLRFGTFPFGLSLLAIASGEGERA